MVQGRYAAQVPFDQLLGDVELRQQHFGQLVRVLPLGAGEGNRDVFGLSTKLTAGWNLRNKLVATVADRLPFRARPSRRTVCSTPRPLTVSRTQFSCRMGVRLRCSPALGLIPSWSKER